MYNLVYRSVPYVLVTILLSVLAIGSYNTCNRPAQPTIEQQLQAYKDSTHHWRNQYDQLVATKQSVVGTREEVARFYDLDSVAAVFNTKAKYLENSVTILTQAISKLKPSGQPVIVYRDTPVYIHGTDTCRSVKYMEQDFSSAYHNLKVRIGDSAYANLKSWDTLQITHYRAYTRHFLSKQWYTLVGVRNANPDVLAQIVGDFSIKDAVRTNYLDLKAGVSYWSGAPSGQRMLYGAEAEYVRGKWSGYVRYDRPMVNPDRKEFLIGGLRYSLLRL